MLETESDRIEMIRALGMGCRVVAAGGEADIVFDNLPASLDAPSGFRQSDRSISFTITTKDARKLGLERGVPVTVVDAEGNRSEFSVRDPQPDGTGMTLVELDAV